MKLSASNVRHRLLVCLLLATAYVDATTAQTTGGAAPTVVVTAEEAATIIEVTTEGAAPTVAIDPATDPLTTSAADTTSVSTEGTAPTVAPVDSTTEYSLPTDNIVLHCGEDFMTVIIPTCLLTGGMTGENLQLNDDSCVGIDDVSGNITLTTKLTECGTTREEDGDTFVYKNQVTNVHTNDTVSRQYIVEIPFECSYSRSGRVFAEWYELKDYVLDTELADSGKYHFDLKLYTDENYSETIAGYPYLIGLNEGLYFAASLGSVEYSGLDLSIKACKATHGENYDTVIHYDLITNWEPEDAETSITCASRPSSVNIDQVRVQTHAFRFVELEDNQGTVYIHCDLYVCATADDESACSDQCNGTMSRRRRDVSLQSPPLPIQQLTRGPIRIRRYALEDDMPHIETSDDIETPQSSQMGMMGLTVVSMGAVVVVLLAALVVTLRKLSNSSSKEKTRADTEASVGLLENGNSE